MVSIVKNEKGEKNSGDFLRFNLRRRSVTLDLISPAGQQVFKGHRRGLRHRRREDRPRRRRADGVTLALIDREETGEGQHLALGDARAVESLFLCSGSTPGMYRGARIGRKHDGLLKGDSSENCCRSGRAEDPVW